MPSNTEKASPGATAAKTAAPAKTTAAKTTRARTARATKAAVPAQVTFKTAAASAPVATTGSKVEAQAPAAAEAPAASTATTPAAEAPAATPTPAAASAAKPAVAPAAKAEPKADPKPAAKTTAKSAPKAPEKATAKTTAKAPEKDSAKNSAKAAEKSAPTEKSDERTIVLAFPVTLDQIVSVSAFVAKVPTAAVRRVTSTKSGLPVYLGLGGLAVAGIAEWPVAAVAGVGYAVLRRWGPLRRQTTAPATSEEIIIEDDAAVSVGAAG